jgi:hypothetical protein
VTAKIPSLFLCSDGITAAYRWSFVAHHTLSPFDTVSQDSDEASEAPVVVRNITLADARALDSQEDMAVLGFHAGGYGSGQVGSMLGGYAGGVPCRWEYGSKQMGTLQGSTTYPSVGTEALLADGHLP